MHVCEYLYHITFFILHRRISSQVTTTRQWGDHRLESREQRRYINHCIDLPRLYAWTDVLQCRLPVFVVSVTIVIRSIVFVMPDAFLGLILQTILVLCSRIQPRSTASEGRGHGRSTQSTELTGGRSRADGPHRRQGKATGSWGEKTTAGNTTSTTSQIPIFSQSTKYHSFKIIFRFKKNKKS